MQTSDVLTIERIHCNTCSQVGELVFKAVLLI